MRDHNGPERLVGHFERIGEGGGIEWVRVALELQHWQSLYAITTSEANAESIVPGIIQAIEANPDEPVETAVIRYIEQRYPPLPADLGHIVRS